jgi:hypothetical protein
MLIKPTFAAHTAMQAVGSRLCYFPGELDSPFRENDI